MGRVDFFIAGVQKGGTTALDHYLRDHPAIQMASVKEVHAFDDETADWSVPTYERLQGAFDWTIPGVIRGEATPIYSYWPNALERLHAYNPQARLILLLRHPSFRAHSHWRMETTRGNDTWPFADAIGATGRARVATSPGGAHRVFSYVERGFYAPQLRRAFSLFPREQILLCRTDRLWSDPAATLAAVQDFLGVPHQTLGEQRYVVPVMTWSPDPIARDIRATLDAIFTDDIRETAALSGLDLTDWLDPDYREPMAPADRAVS